MINKGQCNFYKVWKYWYRNDMCKNQTNNHKLMAAEIWLICEINEKCYTFKITTEVACLSKIDSLAFFSWVKRVILFHNSSVKDYGKRHE